MSTRLLLSGIRDNHTRGAVGDFLREQVRAGSRLAVVSAYFTIYAYEQLRDRLDGIEHMDFLFGEPRFVNAHRPGQEREEGVRDRRRRAGIWRTCSSSGAWRARARQWIRARVTIRSLRQANLLHGKMVHIANQGVDSAILGSANFTTRGLGLAGLRTTTSN
jgi:phosphatidylserine/phosphatidylglycerophosphate/cardiolipin synthase-like enzyme